MIKVSHRLHRVYEYSVPVHIFKLRMDTLEWLELNCKGDWGYKYFTNGAKYANVSFALSKDMIMFLNKVNL